MFILTIYNLIIIQIVVLFYFFVFIINREYIRERRDQLKLMLVLLDSRRGVTSMDALFMGFLNEHQMPFQVWYFEEGDVVL